MSNRRWYYLLPLAGTVFAIWYLKNAFVDVVYSDYIRLVNSYLPDVWNPDKFFVGDVLTRIPLNYLARIINTVFFDYRIRFDQVLGALSLGMSAVLLTSYCVKKNVGIWWYICLSVMMFSLNKWEMMINGSGWIHFFAFVGFYYHYLVLERMWSGHEKKGDHLKLLCLPWFLTLAAAGPYCAIYTVVLVLVYCLKFLLIGIREKQWEKTWLLYGISAIVPLCLYLWSNACVTDFPQMATEASFMEQLLDTPGYMARFVVKSFGSMVIGVECAQTLFATGLPALVLGFLVMAGYALAFWFHMKYHIYEETVFPLVLLTSGVLNHVLVLLNRWAFLNEDYGMSSRYALQFQIGIFGMILTFALMSRKSGKEWRGKSRLIGTAAMAAVSAVLLAGNGYTTREEIRKAPYRKEACTARAELALDFENRTDDELRAGFEYRTGNPESGAAVRRALEILKENKWNIFRE